MYSGSDSTESQNYPQWALNPTTYQNVSNDQVDWAALAQQWIIMKEAGPPPVITEQKSKTNQIKDSSDEGGEAPMEVENDKDDSINNTWNTAAAGPQPPGSDWTWNAQNQSWGWNNAWVPPTGVPPPAPMKPPLLPTPASANYNQYNAPPDSNSDNATFTGYTTGQNNDYTTGYWTAAGSSKQIKPHNRRFSKVNIPRPVQTTPAAIPTESQPPLDAAKRKQLPAWIREGLEKMERDKQKQLEKEKEKQEREEYNEKMKRNERETMEILKSTIKEQQRSKFESDGEYSDEDGQEIKPEPVQLTAEEHMMNVRRAMTEILLKVTNREIEAICREELQRHHRKLKASDQRVSAPTGANITAKLGVSMYGSDSETSNDGTDEDSTRRNSKDSDTELKDSIKRKKAEFSKTEKAIQEKLNEAESRHLPPAGSRSSTPDTNGNETQVDAKIQGRKSTRSDTTATTQSHRRTRSTSSSSDTSYNDNKRRYHSRHSSSSSSSINSSGHINKKSSKHQRQRSISRSHTPDRSHRSSKNDTSKSSSSSNRRRSRSTSSRRRRESTNSKSRYSSTRRTKSRSVSRSRRSLSRSPGSYRKGRRSTSRHRRSRSRNRRSRSRSRSRRSRSRSNRRRRSRSVSSSSRGKRSRRH